MKSTGANADDCLIEADEGRAKGWHAAALAKAEHARVRARACAGEAREIRRGRGPQSPGSSCLDEGLEAPQPAHEAISGTSRSLCVSLCVIVCDLLINATISGSN